MPSRDTPRSTIILRARSAATSVFQSHSDSNSAFERTRVGVVGLLVTVLVCLRRRARRSTQRYAA